MKSPAVTTLERFLRKNKLQSSKVAHETGISRQQLARIRAGKSDLRFMTAMRLRDACGRLLSRRVSIDELFDTSDPQASRTRR